VSTVRDAFRQQAKACAALGSPLMARLMAGLAEALAPGTPVSDAVLGWPGDPSSSADSVPLRLAGGLHALVLSGQDKGLAAAYALPDADPAAAALAAIDRHPETLLAWLASPPQTNEVRRSAVLIATAHWLTARFGLPLVLSELGASAGLNLLWDRYGLVIGARAFGPPDPVLTLAPDWTGPLPPIAKPGVIARRGVDLSPPNPVADRLRLLAYLWPDQPDRLARTRAALDLAAQVRPDVEPPGWKPGLPPAMRARCISSVTPSPGSTSRPKHAPAPLPHWTKQGRRRHLPPLSPAWGWRVTAPAQAQPSP
jgi:hypothetical protein